MIVESAIQFGEGNRLSGVFTRAATQSPRAVLGLVNSGFIPRSGPGRVYTQLARRLASEGIASFRFDLGGLGDSLGRSEGRLIDRTREEIAAALDVMAAQEPGAALALGGICSGAEDSYRQAAGDARVRAVVMIDPFAWRTAGFAWRYAAFRLRRRVLRGVGYWSVSGDAPADDWVNFTHMKPDEASDIVRRLAAQRTSTHFIYTGGLAELFNHPAQLGKMLPETRGSSLVTVDHLPAIDHTQLLQEERDRLIETIVRRLSGSLSPRASRLR